MLKIMAELHWNGLKGFVKTLAFVAVISGALFLLTSLLGA